MSFLFYRRPDYTHPPTTPLNQSDCAKYVERAKGAERAIPPGLAFEDVLANKSLPPCALSDFMDYLVYIEHNAENLQFYLWYQDYEKRFNALPEKERVLAPEWKPEQKEPPHLIKDKDKDREVTSLPRPSVISPASRPSIASPTSKFFDGMSTTNLFGDEQDGKSVRPDGSSFISSIQGSVATTAAEATTQVGLKWQPFTIQPFREECTHIIQHYLAPSSLRELNISHKDRHTILHALQHTTHPSAFAPAFNTCSAVLRGQSHPNFVRWSICNGNKPRVLAVRHLCIHGVILSFAAAVLLTLSHHSRWWRIFCHPLWLISFTGIVSAYKGMCIIMFAEGHSRNLRPWEEVDSDEETLAPQRNSTASDVRTFQLNERAGGFDDKDTDRGSATDRVSSEQDADTGKGIGRSSRWRPNTLKTFGPSNAGWESETWVERYRRRGLARKIFERETWVQDPTLRMLQDRIVYGALFWAALLATCLTIGFVALPQGNFY